jgi:hypothetical protein
MSTPNTASQQHHMGHSTINMAVAQAPKSAKPASKASSTSATATAAAAATANANATTAAAQKAAKVQMHRRSRTGWFTPF